MTMPPQDFMARMSQASSPVPIGVYLGLAPEADLVGLRVFNDQGGVL